MVLLIIFILLPTRIPAVSEKKNIIIFHLTARRTAIRETGEQQANKQAIEQQTELW